jgi:hypothetical protein
MLIVNYCFGMLEINKTGRDLVNSIWRFQLDLYARALVLGSIFALSNLEWNFNQINYKKKKKKNCIFLIIL